MNEGFRIAIIGAGNIGQSIAKGLVQSGHFNPGRITLTRRRAHLLEEYRVQGFSVTDDNIAAVNDSDVVIVSVEPQIVDGVLGQIGPALDFDRHILISVVTGISIRQIEDRVGKPIRVARAMPNTAIAVRESMTCIASNGPDDRAVGGAHPESEIDKVTTPNGCTISGLNCMEHEGFSSAMIRGITISAEKAARLYREGQG